MQTYEFTGKYGSWQEEHSSLETARCRAYALNVSVREVKP